MVELRENEIRILEALDKRSRVIPVPVELLMKDTGLSDSAIMRSGLVLQEKNWVKISVNPHTMIRLTDEGEKYAIECLPERCLVDAVISLNGRTALDKAAEKACLKPQFVKIALGWALRKKWATFDSKTSTVQVTHSPDGGEDEILLRKIRGRDWVPLSEVLNEKEAISVLKKRQLLIVEEKTERGLKITDEGIAAIQKVKHEASTDLSSSITIRKVVTQITPELIITGKWRDAALQKYNVEAPVAAFWPGKKHPYLSFLDEVRAKLVTLGFKEMTGTAVETSFFNFDALFTPQDHPARELDGIYRVKKPEFGDVSAYADAVNHVKAAHENGGDTGSTGWGYKYSKREAERLILRGHGTCLSARTLLSKNLEVPSKYFSIARVYRPEVVDKTHLSEFNQVEGIIVDEKLTLRDLLGVLGKFALEIAGADKIRFKPDYFPFTEPSVELSAYKEGFGWVEFGGSGIFRPEVTEPLGVKVPVIAWGLGVDRLFMMRAGMDDIRCIFSQNLDWLRKKEVA